MNAAGIPVALRVTTARASVYPWLRTAVTPGRWYPAMPPLLQEEENDDTGLYEERLLDSLHGPYDHARDRECAVGFHTSCTGQGCECPHHSDPGREWTGAAEPVDRFASVYNLPKATAARVLSVAQEGFRQWWVTDLESLRSLLSAEYGGAQIPRAFALDVACALYDNAERQGDAAMSKAWERVADVDWQAADADERAEVDGGPAEPVGDSGLVVAGEALDVVPAPTWSGDPVKARVEAARSSELAHVRETVAPGRWYPAPVPPLRQELDESGRVLDVEYRARLVHSTHGPYDHVRSLDCASGEHVRCAMRGCACPHHAEPALESHEVWHGPFEVAERFAAEWGLPFVTAARVLHLAGEMMWGQFRADEAVDGAPGVWEIDAVRDTLADAYGTVVTRRFARSVAVAMLAAAVAREDRRDIEAWAPLAQADYEGLDEIDRQLARLVTASLPMPDEGMAGEMGEGRALRPVLLNYYDAHRELGRWGTLPWVVASPLLLALAPVPPMVFGWSWLTVAVGVLLAAGGLGLTMLNVFGAGERNALRRWRVSIIRAGLPPTVVDAPLPIVPALSAEVDGRGDAGTRGRR